ncbi:hypothetical protein KIH74_28960 [Kineosporia sp. J2-2]|uniref:Uncharacterized protein n=1 Tax=Kineosporia corallincola TaxID=2835133 RepID=A0ABS5TR35_9ACTN|nr:hypothetical protein [Kineosporia corallincola]MBT0773008.1 hypothetical protein [Kineosporia corallincola]
MPEDELLQALRALGADHEPDVAAIRRRMDDQRPKVVPLRRRVEAAPRKRPVLLSAVAALLVGGGVTVAASQMAPASETTPSKLPVNIPAFETPTADTTSQTPSPSGTTPDDKDQKNSTPDDVATSKSGSKAGSTDEPGSGSTSDGSRTTDAKTGSSSTGSSTQAITSVSELTAGQALSLGDADEDWLAIGTRNDLKTIQKKTALASPLISFTAPESGQSVDGPFKLSWTGGAPEQDRDGTTRWLQTDGATVKVMASSAASTVTLYTGNAMNVSVSGQDLKAQTTTLGDSAAGYAVTVQIPSHSGETTITLESGRGPVHLLAATAASS